MIKILWICGSGVYGGAERATLRLLELLRERGHGVEALCRPLSAVERAITTSQVRAYTAPLGGPLDVRSIRVALDLFDAARPDLALLTTSSDWLWPCLIPRRRRPRLVVVRHMALPMSRPLLWVVRRRADAVVAVSEAVRAVLVGRTKLPGEIVHVIHNPVRFSPRATVPTREERVRARESFGFDPAGHWVGFFGGLDPAKGVQHVLSAVAEANQRVGRTQLLICGRQGNGRFEELTTAFPEAGQPIYLGEIDRVREALTACDVVVMATWSTLSEALPLIVMEAMACGTPVLAYATGGIPELIGSDGQAGRLARPDDAHDLARLLVEVLADAAGAEHLAHTGLERMRQRFAPQRAAERYEQLFLKLCAPP